MKDILCIVNSAPLLNVPDKITFTEQGNTDTVISHPHLNAFESLSLNAPLALLMVKITKPLHPLQSTLSSSFPPTVFQ